ILVLQKRDAGAAAGGAAWDTLAEAVPAEDGEVALSINRYFVDHPEMVLGSHARTSSAYGPAYTCRPVFTIASGLNADAGRGVRDDGRRAQAQRAQGCGRGA